MSKEIYKQQIINRFQKPQHKGVIGNASSESELTNSLCGDRLHFHIVVENNYIRGAKWTGEGCAISLAAADLLADKIINQEVEQVLQISTMDMLALLGVDLKPSREKCATLSLDCVKQALAE